MRTLLNSRWQWMLSLPYTKITGCISEIYLKRKQDAEHQNLLVSVSLQYSAAVHCLTATPNHTRAQRTHRTMPGIHVADTHEGAQVSKPVGTAARGGGWNYCFQTENVAYWNLNTAYRITLDTIKIFCIVLFHEIRLAFYVSAKLILKNSLSDDCCSLKNEVCSPHTKQKRLNCLNAKDSSDSTRIVPSNSAIIAYRT